VPRMQRSSSRPAIVAATRDLLDEKGTLAFPAYPIGAFTERDDFSLVRVDITRDAEIDALRSADFLLSVPHGTPLDDRVLSRADRLVAVLRLGVGYEDCDLDELTRRSIALVVPSRATQRPTAVAALTLLLALATRLLEKDRVTREGPPAWPKRAALRSLDLRGKTLGLIGCGTIGRELLALAAPLGLRMAVCDPAMDSDAVRSLGARPMSLEELLGAADFVSLHCPLTPKTRHLIDRRRLSLMGPSAYLINTARGGVVDQAALVDALARGAIAGAGLDVFESEPVPEGDPLLSLPNVVLSAHALNWTAELDRDMGEQNLAAALALLAGEKPEGLVNGAVWDTPEFKRKLSRLRERTSADCGVQQQGTLA
jgi:phosphoglycerate dehydrogenase-like enzyme